ncbi:MAG: TonB-dependent receptor plug domain-containing protein [Rudaea sp.]
MRLDANKLSSAVRLALSLGVVATAGTVTANAQNAGNTANTNQKSQALETIVVTGSNIRRVDIETANPVITIDHAAIEKSGKVTLGDLVQALPAMAGAATNPQVNNGGGGGASGISLRGLGSSRSLLLLNGHRIPSQLQDLNMIPASAVERIEVLADGASSVYGSDAVAGVVNVITRTTYQGAEVGADYGISDRDDGQRKAGHFMFGQTSDKGSILFGIQYNKQDAVSAANRKFSHDALYKYNTGYVLHGGSSRTPNGSISLGSAAAGLGFHGCSGNRVTRLPGTSGTSLADYRCYNPATDAFNYQAVGNYDLTPSERTGAFVLGDYKVTDNIDAYAQIFHNKTVSMLQIAPVPPDALNDGWYIPANQYYNPFGIAFGIDPNGQATNQFRTRLVSLGNRGQSFSSTHDLDTLGLKGNIGDTSWSWNVDYSYGHLSQLTRQLNYINYTQLASNFGCTTAPGAGSCTPINFFNIFDPTTIALLNSAKIDPFTNFVYQNRTWEGSVNGSLFDLPAGSVQLAAGGDYRKENSNFTVDPLITTHVDSNLNFTCNGPGSICTSPQAGGFNVKEAYAELLVPLLKDMPWVNSLNLDIGDRYSKYSLFGSTNNWKVAVEYKPIEDLLLRGTVSKVFRAPSITDIYRGPAGDSPTATDPCGSAAVASNPACQGYTFVNTGTSQVNGIVSGQNFASQNLGTKINVQPENGKSFDYGFVYSPHWVDGLTVNADYYRIVLNNLIISGAGTAQTILTQCFNSPAGNPSPVCSAILRYPTGGNIGQLKYVFEVPFNSGQLTTSGIDLGATYRLPTTPFGNFNFAGKATYIGEYNVALPGFTQHVAGHFDKTYGNFARWRGLFNVDWNMGPWSASYQARYIGHITIGYANSTLGPSASADGLYTPAGASIYHYGAQVYHNVSAGYNIEPLNTQLEIGVDNLSDKQPPIFFQQNVINANTDVNTYDTMGRYYWAKVTVKF